MLIMLYHFIQSRTEEEEAKIRDLEKSLRKEKERSEKFQTDYLTFKVRNEPVHVISNNVVF